MNRTNSFKAILAFAFLILVALPLFTWSATSSSSVQSTSTLTEDVASSTPELSVEELAKQQLEFEIRKKNFELEGIKAAIQKNEEALSKTQGQKTSLQKELGVLRGQQSVLTKQIQQDQISLERLNLEIKSITYDLQDIQAGVVDKRQAMQELLRMIQRSDNTNILTILLKNQSLADSVLEIKNLDDLNARLTTDILSLKNLTNEYTGKLKNLNEKQNAVELQAFNLKNRKVVLANQETQRQQLLKETNSQEAVYQEHLRAVYVQQEAIAAEIEALDAKLRGEIDYNALPVGELLILPIANAATTQGYGATTFAKSGYRGKWHNGLDFRASLGTPVLAAASGRIAMATDQDRYCPRGAYGKVIVINHGDNLTTLYGHLSRMVVAVGDTVKQGQVIGYSGSTGYATGPHLHFTVFAQATFKIAGSRSCGPMPQGGDLNPSKYL
ncbi:MAG: peptidoglycan DD-metalloendopeptidase family protein [Patescibacteria group bacterium]